MTLWLVNPGRGKTRKARKARRRKLTGAALAAHQRKAGRKRAGTARRAAKRATTQGGRMAKGKRRRRANPKRRRHAGMFVKRAKNPGKRHRRRRGLFRRNPGGGLVKGLMSTGMQGVKDAAGVVVGKAATRAVAGLIPFGANTGIVGTLKQVLVAVGVGYGANKVLGREFARMVVAGGIAAPLETLVKSMGIPILSPALSAGDEAYAALGGHGAYPLAGVGMYPPALPAASGYGDGMGADFGWDEM